jgi:hypothetical protein
VLIGEPGSLAGGSGRLGTSCHSMTILAVWCKKGSSLFRQNPKTG